MHTTTWGIAPVSWSSTMNGLIYLVGLVVVVLAVLSLLGLR
jgi:Na+/proline symporter